MTLRTPFRAATAAFLAVLLVACTTMPPPTIQRNAATARAPQAGTPGTASQEAIVTVNGVRTQALPPDANTPPQAIIRRGTGQVINRGAASAPLPNLAASTGAATFNFEGESLQAVVKAIL